MQFKDLNLAPQILESITAAGYEKPSPIQEKAIPVVIEGGDVMAAAQTGTGKTAGFTLPILHNLSKGGEQPRSNVKANQCRALILTPTRELAAQIGDNVEKYGQHMSLKSTVVFGGVKINPQMMRLRGGVDIVIATPGRLLDLYQQNAINFDALEVLVLDEADRMLDMGFIHDIKRIIKALPRNRQNLLFSATFSDDIRNLAKGLVNNPTEISVTPRNTAAKTVKQSIVVVDKKSKPAVLKKLIKENQWSQVLVFSRTKHGANRLAKQLTEANIPASAIHGNKSQGARTRALAEFKDLKVQVLVATDIAARGIDIDELPYVVNFDLPNVPEDYVHRIGRTGRAGATGEAVSLVCADEIDQLQDIERLLQKVFDREMVDGYEPKHDVPTSKLKPPKKPNKPKRTKSGGGRSDGGRNGNNDNKGRGRNDSRGDGRGKSQGGRNSKQGGKGRNQSRNGSNEQREGSSNQRRRPSRDDDSSNSNNRGKSQGKKNYSRDRNAGNSDKNESSKRNRSNSNNKNSNSSPRKKPAPHKYSAGGKSKKRDDSVF